MYVTVYSICNNHSAAWTCVYLEYVSVPPQAINKEAGVLMDPDIHEELDQLMEHDLFICGLLTAYNKQETITEIA